MAKLRLTSPGMLLILALLSGGGILLLDLCYLHPVADAQVHGAIREQALRANDSARMALRTEQKTLARLCAAAANSLTFQQALETGQCDKVSIRQLEMMQVDIAWVCRPNADVLFSWSLAPSRSPGDRDEMLGHLARVDQSTDNGRWGIANLPNGAAIYAICPLRSAPGEQATACLGLARFVRGPIIDAISDAVGNDVVFVSGEVSPPKDAETAASHSYWLAGDLVCVASPVQDDAGKVVGMLRTDLPFSQAQRNAETARRIVLIVTSLSLGLAALVVLGSHMLVTGPVLRLLRRIQEVEKGNTDTGVLSRDMHGEPLLLARRLESAFEKLAMMSRTDQLTGLANRRHFNEVLACFYHQSRRYNRPMSVMVMDVDFFKAINDSYGHAAGDAALKTVGEAIERSCRQADLPCRLGGDEFAVLMPETSAFDAGAVAERICEAVREIRSGADAGGSALSVSIGIADLNAGEIDSPSVMIALADKAMYAAKELGRDRVVQAHDLNGLGLAGDSHQGADKLCRKLAGLDAQFKDLFVHGIEEVVSVLEQRDPHMAHHARKVRHYSVLLAQKLGLPDRVVARIQVAAMLHDIGMIALPDSVILSPGPLDERQLQLVRKHPLLSVRIMERMEFLEQEVPAVRYHHERFDGKGYPEGIKGTSIPLSARILAVADSFDAMVTPRAFRGARSVPEALRELTRAAGSQFDPAVVRAFLDLAQELGERLTEIPPTDRADLEAIAAQVAQDNDVHAGPDRHAAEWRSPTRAEEPA